ncbi:MAG: redoxin family protein [Planctomycetota bacterium]
MKTYITFLAVLLTFALAITAFAQAVTLKVGDPAPPLQQGEYLKGEPVTEFEEGTVYVLEFWATWCGPCIQAIPHVTKLQQHYGDDVVMIGQNVWEQDDSAPAPFVQRMGDEMDYRVALDDKSADPEGAMATTWLRAAGQNGIPCSIIIDQQGIVAWIGHPMAMDGPLEKIVAGNFDAAAEAAKAEQLDALNQEIGQALQAGDIDGALAHFAELEVLSPDMAPRIGVFKMALLAENNREAEANVIAAGLADSSDDPQVLNEVAWTMVAPDSLFKNPDFDVALTAAEKANELTNHGDAGILDNVARVHYRMGHTDKAIEFQQKAIEVNDEPALMAELKKSLDEYRAGQ